MKGTRKFLTALLIAVVFSLVTYGSVFAGSDDNAYGLVFIDSNMNGVWDKGEEGYKGEWKEFWEGDDFVRKYVGATITLTADDGAHEFDLESAGYRPLTEDEIEDDLTDICTYQDFTVADGSDDDEAPDVNPAPARPCAGTWGMPASAGEDDLIWKITLTPPPGYMVTSANPQFYTVGSKAGPVDFGIALAGAGGPVAEMVLLPVTGSSILILAALGIMLTGGAAVAAGRKLRK